MKVFYSLLLIASLLLVGCSPTSESVTSESVTAGLGEEQAPRSIDPPAAAGALAPELTSGPSGVWLSWIEPEVDSEPPRHRLRAARWDGDTPTEPARATVWWNGVKIHNNVAIKKANGGEKVTSSPEGLKLQEHGQDVRFRNVWVKEMKAE